jgi:hypothetical protein
MSTGITTELVTCDEGEYGATPHRRNRYCINARECVTVPQPTPHTGKRCDYRRSECSLTGTIVNKQWICDNHQAGRVSDTLSDRGRPVANPEHQGDKSVSDLCSPVRPAPDAGGEFDVLDDPRMDKEIRRWQDAIRDKLIDLGVPDHLIDGAGCDSGDPLDYTLAEVGQGVGYFVDQRDELHTRAAVVPGLVEALKGLGWHSQNGVDTCWCHVKSDAYVKHTKQCEDARAALAATQIRGADSIQPRGETEG